MQIAVVCLGNICRSPMGGAVLRAAVADAGLADRVEITSAGTADYHVGKPADERTDVALGRRGYETVHVARQFTASDFADHDLVLAMDQSNRDNLRRIAPTDEDRAKVMLFRSFDANSPGDAEVPDPYYDGRFEEVLDIIEATTPSLIDELQRRTTQATD